MIRMSLKTLNRILAGVVTTAAIAAGPAASAQNIVYVDDDGFLSGDGMSWSTAYRYLQDALDTWGGSFQPVEIRVAQGEYRPDANIANPLGTGDRSLTFQLYNNLSIVGGYRGLPVQGGEDPNERNVAQFPTVLSGDLLLNDEPPFNLEDNSFHVVTGSGTNATAVLDGVTVTGGFSDINGGGMINDLGSPTVTNCTFTECVAADSGGAIANQLGSNPLLDSCTFIGNSAIGGLTGSFGGAMANVSGSASVINNCTFELNEADSFGGAVYNGTGTNVTITASNITNNTAGVEGGGIYTAVLATLGVAGTTACGNTPDNIIGPMTDNGGNTICGGPCPQDLNANGDVDFADIFAIINNWGPCPPGPCSQDISGNGDVDFADIFEVVGNWGPCP